MKMNQNHAPSLLPTWAGGLVYQDPCGLAVIDGQRTDRLETPEGRAALCQSAGHSRETSDLHYRDAIRAGFI